MIRSVPSASPIPFLLKCAQHSTVTVWYSAGKDERAIEFHLLPMPTGSVLRSVGEIKKPPWCAFCN